MMIENIMPLMMFAVLFVVLALGIPIAFSLCLTGIVFSYFLWGVRGFTLITSAAWGTMNNFTLIAIPLFIFMAGYLEKAGVVSDLYDAFYKWFGPVRGGLAIATVWVGAVVGAVSGVVAAGVIGLGLIALPEMIKYKYDRRIGIGSVMAGGTLGQLIPPSLNMVVYGAITGTSVGKLFAGGILAGLLLALLFSIYILLRAYFNPNLCPALPLESRATWRQKVSALKEIALPALLIILVLGSILSGAATPTEGAAVGAFGAILYSILTRRFRCSFVKQTLYESVRVTTMVGWVIIGASFFSGVFSGIGGNKCIINIATSLPGGKWGFLVMAVLFLLFLGMFLETTAMIMLAAPIVSPALASFGFDPLWWGIVFMTLLQIAYLSPPFGFALFYLKGVTPKDVTMEEIYLSSIPFMGLQILVAILLIAFPRLALWLPSLMG